MVTIRNNLVGKKIIDDLRVQQSVEQPPMETSDKIVLVYQVNDPLFYRTPIARNATLTNAVGPATIFTTPTDADFYLQSCNISSSVGALHAGETSAILATIGGVSSIIVQCEFQTAAGVQGMAIAQSFPFPLKVDRGTSIILLNDDATDVETNGCITGFTTNPQSTGN